jgi:hypothetical protein
MSANEGPFTVRTYRQTDLPCVHKALMKSEFFNWSVCLAVDKVLQLGCLADLRL